MNPNKQLNQAEALLQQGRDREALAIYEGLCSNQALQGLAWFRKGEIFNRQKEVQKAIEAHRKAFECNPALFASILPANISHRDYVYTKKNWLESSKCPLCSEEGQLHSCYNAGASMDFHREFDPVKIWYECKSCEHLFALSRPSNLKAALSGTDMASLQKPEPGALPEESKILNEILEFSSGDRLLEIGSGVGEFLAVAQELLLDAEGLEIRSRYAVMVRSLFDLTVHECDFLEFETEKRFDILVMGDVLEHFIDPVEALQKCYSLLNEKGILWLSTPNHQSGWTKIHKDQDPMWRVSEHLHFFSYKGLRRVLKETGFEVKRYNVSKKYNGSMELILSKK